MAERGDGDWFADSEGNLTGPGELTPDTDEFGRTIPRRSSASAAAASASSAARGASGRRLQGRPRWGR